MSELSKTATGGCFCGAVRYEVTRAPDRVVVCHCSDCRRAAGAQSVAFLILPRAGFAWLQGTPVAFRSSAKVTRTFCGGCGASLTYEHDEHPERIDVGIGTLDDPNRFVPTETAFENEKLSWAART